MTTGEHQDPKTLKGSRTLKTRKRAKKNFKIPKCRPDAKSEERTSGAEVDHYSRA